MFIMYNLLLYRTGKNLEGSIRGRRKKQLLPKAHPEGALEWARPPLAQSPWGESESSGRQHGPKTSRLHWDKSRKLTSGGMLLISRRLRTVWSRPTTIATIFWRTPTIWSDFTSPRTLLSRIPLKTPSGPRTGSRIPVTGVRSSETGLRTSLRSEGMFPRRPWPWVPIANVATRTDRARNLKAMLNRLFPIVVSAPNCLFYTKSELVNRLFSTPGSSPMISTEFECVWEQLFNSQFGELFRDWREETCTGEYFQQRERLAADKNTLSFFQSVQ